MIRTSCGISTPGWNGQPCEKQRKSWVSPFLRELGIWPHFILQVLSWQQIQLACSMAEDVAAAFSETCAALLVISLSPC